MKTLLEHLNESLNEFFTTEISDATSWVVDYLYNEGVVDYQDDSIEAIVHGGKEPDYQDVINVILLDYKKDISDGPYKLLKKYPNTPKKNDIEQCIRLGFKKFLEKPFF